MPRHPWEIEINSETPLEDLLQCIIAVERTSNPAAQKAAAQAKAEIERRDQQQSEKRFIAESMERVKAQRFQEGQMTRQIEAQAKWMAQQIEVAKDQTETAKGAERAAKWSAVATVAIAILTAILAVAAAITLLST